MARKPKLTVDYFPHIINQGKTIFILENNYGNDGYAFWFKLLELLGNTENHFIDCNNISTWQFMLAKTRVSEDIANSILNTLADLEAIDKELWSEKIIFSQKFIDNITDLYRRRGINVVNKQSVLDLCRQKSSITDNNVNKKPQIKLNEIKENEIKENEGINVYTYPISSVPYQFSQNLFNLNLKIDPTLPEPNFQEWSRHVDNMIKEDINLKEMLTVLNWCKSDEFWRTKILNTEDFHRHYERMSLQMKGNTNKQTKKQTKKGFI